MATGMLADQGADVVKVEPPGLGDLVRYLGPARNGLSAMFVAANRGKRGIAVDLKSARGRSLLMDLVRGADVLVQNFRPGVVERMGLGYQALSAVNPGLIYASISGFGPTGPYADRRVYDPVVQASSGLASMQRDPETGDPQLIQSLICDKVTAVTAAQAISAALFARTRAPDGRGQHLELSMLDAAVSFIWPDGMYNHTFLDGDVEPQPDLGSYYRLRKAQDAFVTFSALSDTEFAGLCKALGAPELASDERFATLQARALNAVVLGEVIDRQIEEIGADDLVNAMTENDVPAAKVREREDLHTDPQIRHNGTLLETNHPVAGSIRLPRPPARFHATPEEPGGPAPVVGGHTDEILKELGLGDEDIAALRAEGVVA